VNQTPFFTLLCGAATALSLLALPAQGQDMAPAPVNSASPHQVVHLSASAQTELSEDWLSMTLSVQLDGAQATSVQKQLNAVLSAAMQKAQAALKPGAVELSTGNMNVSPRYGRDGKIQGWTGVAQMVLQGRDAEQIAAVAGRLEGLSVANIAWRLSAERKTEAEARLQAEAVARFQSKAQSLTKQFGFASYTLREVRTGENENGAVPMARMAMMAMDPSGSAVPTLPGKTKVVVSMAGSIQMR
jgi:predicted secreted protein